QAMIPPNTSAWLSLPPALRETPLPMPSFFLGNLYLSVRAATGQVAYLNGHLSGSGWWLYFPEALAVKSTIGFLLALTAAQVFFAIGPRRRPLRSCILLVPSAVYFVIAMHSRYQLGIRHLLPILPLMYLFIAMHLSSGRRAIALLSLILLAGIETAAVHPDYLAFFNIASGGPRNGERYLIDSNLDWGQDRWRLTKWMKSDEANGRDCVIRV